LANVLEFSYVLLPKTPKPHKNLINNEVNAFT